MIAAPSLPAALAERGRSSRERVLAVVCGCRERDERTLRWAAALAAEHQAGLTVLCLWSFPPMWPWIALSGTGAAVQLLELHRRETLRWVEHELEREVGEPVRILSARHCEAPARVVAAELAASDHYSCVVGSRRSIGRRAARRFSRSRPELTLVRL